MNKVRHICVLALLLVAAGTARAQQWYGNVDGAGGFGWMKSLRGELLEGQNPNIIHWLGEGNVGFGYKSPKFQWSSKLKVNYEPKTAERYRVEAKGKDEKDLSLRALIKSTDTRPLDLGFRTDFTWTPATQKRYDAWFNFRYQDDADDAETVNATIQSADYTEEWALRKRLTFTSGFKTSHAIGRRTLQAASPQNTNRTAALISGIQWGPREARYGTPTILPKQTYGPRFTSLRPSPDTYRQMPSYTCGTPFLRPATNSFWTRDSASTPNTPTTKTAEQP